MSTSRTVYFDNNATTPLDPRVLDAMQPYLTEQFGNPSSVHSYGQRARYAVDTARSKVATLIGADPEEIIFTGGGTDACNMAIFGHVRFMDGKAKLLSSRVEHPAVLRCVEYLEDTEQAKVDWIEVGEDGVVDLSCLSTKMKRNPSLVTVMAANNDVGTVMPISEVAEIVHSHGALLHSDAVQAVGKIPVHVGDMGVDLLSCSSHKLRGPMGVGALFVKRGVRIAPTIFGGYQENRRRAGTENVAGIVGFGAACELLCAELADTSKKVKLLKAKLEQELHAIEDVTIYGQHAERLPGTCYAGFSGIEGETLQMALDINGFAVSVGSACSSESRKPSHVLTAMGVSAKDASSAIRFSLGPMNTDEEVDGLLSSLSQLLAQLRC